MMNKKQISDISVASSAQIAGTSVRLSFASEQNTEVIAVVREILKAAYLRSQRR